MTQLLHQGCEAHAGGTRMDDAAIHDHRAQVGRISVDDFICAAKADALIAFVA
jgi:hypothetical protein